VSKSTTAVREMLLAGGLLLVFALAGVGLVAYTYDQTAERIEDNRRNTVQRELQAVVPAALHDNAPVRDMIIISGESRLGSVKPLPVYRARLDGEPAAVIFTVVAPGGYSGDILLLVGVLADGTVSGVRVVSHQETPGLGDAIEPHRSDWIRHFNERSLDDPERQHWRVDRDGGQFDRITGATITARAVVNAVRDTLLYFEEHKQTLFEKAAVDGGMSRETEPATTPGTDSESSLETDPEAEPGDQAADDRDHRIPERGNAV